MKEHLVLAQEDLSMAGICWYFCNTTSEPKQRTKIQCCFFFFCFVFWKDTSSLRLTKWISSFIPIKVGTELWFFKIMHTQTLCMHVYIYTHMRMVSSCFPSEAPSNWSCTLKEGCPLWHLESSHPTSPLLFILDTWIQYCLVTASYWTESVHLPSCCTEPKYTQISFQIKCFSIVLNNVSSCPIFTKVLTSRQKPRKNRPDLAVLLAGR